MAGPVRSASLARSLADHGRRVTGARCRGGRDGSLSRRKDAEVWGVRLPGQGVAGEAEARHDLTGHHPSLDTRVGGHDLARPFEGFGQDRHTGKRVGDDGAQDRDHTVDAQ